MAAIRFPNLGVPAWAQEISDEQWQSVVQQTIESRRSLVATKEWPPHLQSAAPFSTLACFLPSEKWTIPGELVTLYREPLACGGAGRSLHAHWSLNRGNSQNSGVPKHSSLAWDPGNSLMSEDAVSAPGVVLSNRNWFCFRLIFHWYGIQFHPSATVRHRGGFHYPTLLLHGRAQQRWITVLSKVCFSFVKILWATSRNMTESFWRGSLAPPTHHVTFMGKEPPQNLSFKRPSLFFFCT